MSGAERRDDNPYIGPSPFERGDRRFFGRDREIGELVSLVVAHRVVVLHAASGAGKTSLINAGLVPVLEEQEAFEVLPVARLRPIDPAVGAGDRNVYTAGVTANWSREQDGMREISSSASLSEALAGWEQVVDGDGFAAPRVVIFDQFEELFSLFAERWADREAFLVQVADALDRDPMLRVVFALREDYLAQLDAYAALFADRLRTRLRLERLEPAAAEAAISGPLAATRRSFAPGVAARLAADLRAIRVHGSAGAVEVEGRFVEPVHLQVACQSLWAGLPASVETITEEHVRTFGNVDEVLLRFYDEVVREAATAAGIKEERLRESLEAAFLTAGDTRGMAYRDDATTAAIPNAAIDELENRHLLRAEWRAGARWYELTHDRLIEPIRTSNAAVAARAARRRNRRVLGGSAALGLIGGVSLVVAFATSKPPPEPCRGCRATLESVTLATNIPLRQFLESRGAPMSGLTARRLRQEGVVADYVVRVPGGGGGAFVVNAVVTDAKRHHVSEPLNGATLVDQGDDLGSGKLWLPTPSKAGRYRIRLQIFALDAPSNPGRTSPPRPPSPHSTPSTITALDSAQSEPFAGIYGPGGPEARILLRVRVEPANSGRVVLAALRAGCRRLCTFFVTAGTRLRFVAMPRARWRFLRWSGGCGAAPACSVTAGRVRSMRARFRRLPRGAPGFLGPPPPQPVSPPPSPQGGQGCAVELGCGAIVG